MTRDELALRFLLHPRSRVEYERAIMRRPVPDLHHYTTGAGLTGIMTSGTIWATDTRHLNDLTEVTYSEDLIRETLIRHVPQVGPEYRPWLTAFSTVVNLVHATVPLYAASFCERGDLLSQWRGYASAGYCLTFDGAVLGALTDCHLVRVVYDADEQRQIIRDTIALHLQALDRARSRSQRDINRVSGNFGAQLALYALCFKNPMFFEEREWRAVTSGDRLTMRYRSQEGNQVPYVEIPLTFAGNRGSDLPLREVIHAPSPEPERMTRELQEHLQKFGYKRSLGRASAIPLRIRTGA